MNIIYNASAGTGKTHQVTGLYVALVLGAQHKHLFEDREPVDPRRILLMTFTDNAAAELRKRVAEQMLKAQQEDNIDLADRARCVLRTLPAAQISTIHSFCTSLLREHALECGLSPEFTVLEKAERDELLDAALREELFQRLNSDSKVYDPDLVAVCAGLNIFRGDHSLLGTVASLIEKAANRGLSLEKAEAMLPVPEWTVTLADFDRICDELAAFDRLPAKASAALQTLEGLCRSGALIRRETVELLTKFTGKGMKPFSDELAGLKEQWLAEEGYQREILKFQAFARYAAAAARAFSESKRRRDLLDFSDLLLGARDLLASDGFKNRFDWIIVDEVQDTSRVQSEIVEALWGGETNLVICGDRKQSIYAWRSADPQVMPELESKIEQRERSERVDLRVSWRSKDRILDAVNDLFTDLYPDYRAHARLEPETEILEANTGDGPCVELLEPAGEPNDPVADEMEAIVRRIAALVGGGEWAPAFRFNNATFAKTGKGNRYRYADILILLKRGTHRGALEAALQKYGIPYSSGGKGKALFLQQEVRDVLLLLQVLTQPANTLALIGFFRSPFALLSDDEIVEFGLGGRPVSPMLAERLERWRERVGTKLASELVREAVRETGFDAVLAAQAGGEQKLANLKKVIDWLRKTERGGRMLIYDVVRRFEAAVLTPPADAAEALLPDPEQNRVTIMTVHSAKGLTKRVCFVPDISFGGKSDTAFALISPEGRLECKLADAAKNEVFSPGFSDARDADRKTRELEQTNLLYVALTRARDLVVLSGSATKEPKGWRKQIEPFLENASGTLVRRVPYDVLPEPETVEAERPLPSSGALAAALKRLPKPVVLKQQRKAVTGLVESQKSKVKSQEPSTDRRSFGSLGHAVLEELTRTGWEGDVPALVDAFNAEFCVVETEALIEQLEAARTLLRDETAGAEAVYAEWPFVLKCGDVILDGAIDLLVHYASACWKIYDYKFSQEPLDAVLESYSPQLAAYKEAVEKLYPGAEISAALVLMGETVQVVPLEE